MTDEQARKPKLVVGSESEEPAIQVPKHGEFDLSKFKSTQDADIANVETLFTALPHYRIADAKDYVRLHEDESKYWSPELCFVAVPIKGQKDNTLHLIDETIAKKYLESARIQRFRLALAAKPYDIFFLCQVPTRNLDNLWNDSNQQACEQAKTRWVIATSRKAEGVEAYKLGGTRDLDAFPSPKWPKQALNEIICRTFAGRMITTEDHPGLLRLIGGKQSVS